MHSNSNDTIQSFVYTLNTFSNLVFSPFVPIPSPCFIHHHYRHHHHRLYEQQSGLCQLDNHTRIQSIYIMMTATTILNLSTSVWLTSLQCMFLLCFHDYYGMQLCGLNGCLISMDVKKWCVACEFPLCIYILFSCEVYECEWCIRRDEGMNIKKSEEMLYYDIVCAVHVCATHTT